MTLESLNTPLMKRLYKDDTENALHQNCISSLTAFSDPQPHPLFPPKKIEILMEEAFGCYTMFVLRIFLTDLAE